MPWGRVEVVCLDQVMSGSGLKWSNGVPINTVVYHGIRCALHDGNRTRLSHQVWFILIVLQHYRVYFLFPRRHNLVQRNEPIAGFNHKPMYDWKCDEKSTNREGCHDRLGGRTRIDTCGVGGNLYPPAVKVEPFFSISFLCKFVKSL